MADYNPWITEWISVSDEEEQFISSLNISVSDSITLAEDITYDRTINIDGNDSITITENVAKTMLLIIKANESITMAESFTWEVSPIPLSVNQSITVAEYRKPLIAVLYKNVNESIVVAELKKLALVGILADLHIWIGQYISITDEEEVAKTWHNIDVSDSITVTEYLDAQGTGAWADDSITVSESITVALLGVNLNVSDSISVTDEDQLYEFPLNVYDNIYVRDIFTRAIADAGVEGIYNTIAVTQLLLASAVRTAETYYSTVFKVRSAIALRCYQDVTAENGAATLDIILQTSPDNSTWYDAVTATQITATGQYSTTMTEPGVYFRAKYTVAGSGTPSFTFASKLTKYMPVGPRRKGHTYITMVR